MLAWEARRGLPDAAAGAGLSDVDPLHELTTNLISAGDYHTALDRILDSTIDLHGTTLDNIQLFGQDDTLLEIARQRGFAAPFLETFRYVSASDPCA